MGEQAGEGGGLGAGGGGELGALQGAGGGAAGGVEVGGPVAGVLLPLALAGADPAELGDEPVGEHDGAGDEDGRGGGCDSGGHGRVAEVVGGQVQQGFALGVPLVLPEAGCGGQGAGELVAVVGQGGVPQAVVAAEDLGELVGDQAQWAVVEGQVAGAVEEFGKGEVDAAVVAQELACRGGRVAGGAGEPVGVAEAAQEGGADLGEVVEGGEEGDEGAGLVVGQAPAVGDDAALGGGEVGVPQAFGHGAGVQGVAAGGVGLLETAVLGGQARVERGEHGGFLRDGAVRCGGGRWTAGPGRRRGPGRCPRAAHRAGRRGR